MRDSECARDVSILIYKMIFDGYLLVPGEISLQELSRKIGCTPQKIGSCYSQIERMLLEKNYATRKCGIPKVIQVSRTTVHKL